MLPLLFFFASTSPFLYSQDISRYLDDGFSTKGKNMLKIAIDPLNGELPVTFEHSFGSKFSLEVGTGPVWIDLQNRFYPDDPLQIKQTGVGFTAWVRPKVYFRTYPEKLYVSVYPKLTVMDKKLFFDVALMNFGYQRIILRRIVVSGEVGVGFRFYKNPPGTIYDEGFDYTTHFLLPVLISFGYLF